MWVLASELPVLWPVRPQTGRPGQRVYQTRRRQLRAFCQLVAAPQSPPSDAASASELGWGRADGRYVLVRAAPWLLGVAAAGRAAARATYYSALRQC